MILKKLVRGYERIIWFAEKFFIKPDCQKSPLHVYRVRQKKNEKFIFSNIVMGIKKKNILGVVIENNWDMFGHTRFKEFIE